MIHLWNVLVIKQCMIYHTLYMDPTLLEAYESMVKNSLDFGDYQRQANMIGQSYMFLKDRECYKKWYFGGTHYHFYQF